MKFLITQDYDDMSDVAAKIVVDQIKKKQNSVLGLATGSTPVGLYKRLVDEYKSGLDFSSIVSFNLDEYIGLPPTHPQSYRYFMDSNLFNYINIKKENIHIPSGIMSDPETACELYDRSIKEAGGIDLQVLGIGRNGHIGFNEPGDVSEVGTHITNLTDDTIAANSRFFDSIEDVPKSAITMGIGTILGAEKIILLASGTDKSEAIAKIAHPYVDTKIPSSFLQLHKDTIVIADKDASSKLDLSSVEYIEI